MRPWVKGLVVAALQVGIVGSLGAKLLVDRAARPRVWARCVPFDPDLPIRGRYVRLQVVVDVPGVPLPPEKERGYARQPVALSVEDGALVARPDAGPGRAPYDSGPQVRFLERDGAETAVLDEPVAYFIPEHVPDPSIRPPGEELWVDLTIPKKGPPRPIRLGIKKDGVLTPLEIR